MKLLRAIIYIIYSSMNCLPWIRHSRQVSDVPHRDIEAAPEAIASAPTSASEKHQKEWQRILDEQKRYLESPNSDFTVILDSKFAMHQANKKLESACSLNKLGTL